mgnify:CR=1 FL=1
MNEPHRPIRVVFADDHPLTRDGIRDALKHAPDIEIVGEATDGPEAQRMVADLHPDVLLLDLVMPGLRPSEIERWVRTHCADTAVVVLTAHDRDCFLAQAVEAGAAGFLTKAARAERIVDTVRRAARGVGASRRDAPTPCLLLATGGRCTLEAAHRTGT